MLAIMTSDLLLIASHDFGKEKNIFLLCLLLMGVFSPANIPLRVSGSSCITNHLAFIHYLLDCKMH